ncbi:MAG: phospholipid-binding protein [Cyanobacteria bacterium J06632_22]
MSVRQGRQGEGYCQSSGWLEDGQSPPWFRGIPPERVGLNGEYDYYGLAKRVRSYLRESVDTHLLQMLKVNQRGRVIVLSGVLPSLELLQQLHHLVAVVPGVDAVETYAVRLESELLMSA